MRLPYELLSSLANCLLNETVFEIVKGLLEIQHVTEQHLFQQRLQFINAKKSRLLLVTLQNNNHIISSWGARFAEGIWKQFWEKNWGSAEIYDPTKRRLKGVWHEAGVRARQKSKLNSILVGLIHIWYYLL